MSDRAPWRLNDLGRAERLREDAITSIFQASGLLGRAKKHDVTFYMGFQKEHIQQRLGQHTSENFAVCSVCSMRLNNRTPEYYTASNIKTAGH
jgi:hypothetical protein